MTQLDSRELSSAWRLLKSATSFLGFCHDKQSPPCGHRCLQLLSQRKFWMASLLMPCLQPSSLTKGKSSPRVEFWGIRRMIKMLVFTESGSLQLFLIQFTISWWSLNAPLYLMYFYRPICSHCELSSGLVTATIPSVLYICTVLCQHVSIQNYYNMIML